MARTCATTSCPTCREQFSIVLQEPVLFSTSIYENIAYGNPTADRDAIEEAARFANAHDFILDQAQGYDTPVGDRGMSLSGGERQRVSLARAFLKDAPILILDEPTSSVDVQNGSRYLGSDPATHGGAHNVRYRPPPEHPGPL